MTQSLQVGLRLRIPRCRCDLDDALDRQVAAFDSPLNCPAEHACCPIDWFSGTTEEVLVPIRLQILNMTLCHH